MKTPALPWTRWLVSVLVIVGIVAVRGYLMANVMGGRYRFSSLCFDAAGLLFVLVACRLADAGLRKACLALMPSPRWAVLRGVCRGGFILLVLLPFVLATLQVHPQKIATRENPGDHGLRHENVAFASEGRQLRGWFLPNQAATATVLVAHGLNANRENFLEPAQLLQSAGFRVLIFDFRGHGDSDGHTITLGYQEAHDVKAAHDWIVRRFPGQPIHALGYSMGASAVLTAAVRFGIFERVCVDGTFSSVENVANAAVLGKFGPLAPLLWQGGRFWIWVWSGADLSRYRPAEAVAKLDPRKLLIIHGTKDPVIPYTEGQLLHQATGGKAQFWTVEGAGHAETIWQPEYADRLGQFFGAP